MDNFQKLQQLSELQARLDTVTNFQQLLALQKVGDFEAFASFQKRGDYPFSWLTIPLFTDCSQFILLVYAIETETGDVVLFEPERFRTSDFTDAADVTFWAISTAELYNKFVDNIYYFYTEEDMRNAMAAKGVKYVGESYEDASEEFWGNYDFYKDDKSLFKLDDSLLEILVEETKKELGKFIKRLFTEFTAENE